MPDANTDRGKKSRTSTSGAIGGSATGSGVDYQVLYAVRNAIELIEEFTAENGFQRCDAMVAMECRVKGRNSLVAWDVGVLGRNIPWQLTETKGNLAKADIAEFCERIAQHELRGKGVRFCLCYGTSSLSYLKELSALVRLAEEASDDEARFHSLVHDECRHAGELLRILGSDAFFGLRQVQLIQFAEQTLQSLINSTATRIASPIHADHLKRFLYERFTKAMGARETVTIRKLFEELNGVGIELRAPRIDDLSHIPSEVRHIIGALRHCRNGIPLSVAANSSNLSPEVLSERLQPFQESGGLSIVEGMLEISPHVRRLSHGDLDEQAERVVEALLPQIKRSNSIEQLRNAVELFRKLSTPSAAMTLKVFQALDKPIKRIGDKKLVLEFATDCLAKARAAPRIEGDNSANKADAKILICGISWVAQRIGQIQIASQRGQQSLEDGKNIQMGATLGWTCNTAFCCKCLGRLTRVEAEGTRQLERRSELLNESVKKLEEARTLFENGVDERGRLGDEVGDCWSLLGRTRLVQGRLELAIEAAVNARKDLIDEDNKDYLDLLILEGDIFVRQFDYAAADAKYQDAIDRVGLGDAEKSEIAARAWLQKGLCEQKAKRPNWRDSIEHAIFIWRSIGEVYMTAAATWQVMELEKSIPKPIEPMIVAADPMIRVETVQLFRERMNQQANRKLLANRAELPDQLVKQLVQQARSNVQTRNRPWTFPS